MNQRVGSFSPLRIIKSIGSGDVISLVEFWSLLVSIRTDHVFRLFALAGISICLAVATKVDNGLALPRVDCGESVKSDL